MERTETSGELQRSLSITIPQRTLIVLSGPAGAGKSTFAQQVVNKHRDLGFRPTMIVSSDHCRALVCDDEANQQVNRDTFDLFHYIIHKRMFQQRPTIADSTALTADARQRLLALAQRHHYHTCLIIFNVTQEICRQRDLQRQRLVGEQVIAYHIGLLQQTILAAPDEGWSQIHILNEQVSSIKIEITTNPC